jgi:hypothetical protein
MKAANSADKTRKRSRAATGKLTSEEVEAENSSALQRHPTRTEMLQLRDWILNYRNGR